MIWSGSNNKSPERARALVHIEAEQRRRKKQRLADLVTLPLDQFLGRTKIEVPVGAVDTALVPFQVWEAQREALHRMATDRLIVFLKARQLGISWLTCGFVLRQCVMQPGQPWLLLSRGQLEANELTRRVGLMYNHHQHVADFPSLVRDNKSELAWSNGSRVLSLPATKSAGRSFTAAGVVLDEWGFMLYGAEVLAAVKPTIDAGGQLFIISSADGPGSAFHRHWQAAEAGSNGYTPIFLPWTARPGRGPGWRDEKIVEAGGDTARVLREYPGNPIEAFTAAAGLVYGEQWLDGPEGGNVTPDADYEPGVGEIAWAVDDGYAGGLDPETGYYPANAHPRVILFAQIKPQTIDIFDELYACKMLEEDQIALALERPYAMPDYAICDSSAATLRRRLVDAEIPTKGGTHVVAEGIKQLRPWLAADKNGRRRIRVHPRCVQLRAEMARYRVHAETGEPIKAFDHGPDALRYLAWSLRYEVGE